MPNLEVTATTNAADSLVAAERFLLLDDILRWKWFAIAMHHSLYSFCVAALHNSNQDDVTTRGHDADTGYQVRIGNDPVWRACSKKEIGRGPAYRLKWTPIGTEPNVPTSSGKVRQKTRTKLITFWSALARVQDDHFWMRRVAEWSHFTCQTKTLMKLYGYPYVSEMN